MQMSDPYDNLLHAVADYVESIGGKAVVVGGVQITHWGDLPGEKLNYRVSVKCTGKRPTKSTVMKGQTVSEKQ